jgi:hypothetical protein
VTSLSTRVGEATIDLLRPPWGGAGWYAIVGAQTPVSWWGFSRGWTYSHLAPRATLAEALFDAVEVATS